ncbi:hypothetical protein C4568_03230 [Candidatus Parcubacteria bacterium]|nr:MAG: hypothetical protein C4568_03230 [Candidatus Parcubacteria bacterium]
MKYLSFEIQDYRAVARAIIPVGNNLIPIIGINESGKTTILQAILAFDKNKDRYNRGVHLEHKNKYELGEKGGKVSAQILIESKDDLEWIASKLDLNVATPRYKALEAFFDNKKPITLSRVFPGKLYQIENTEFDIGTKKEKKDMANALYERLPFVLYFDDFSDRVPEQIEFFLKSELQIPVTSPEGGQTFRTQKIDKHRPAVADDEWHEILEEVFKRAGNHTLADFLKMKDGDDQKGLMSDIQDTLQREVMEDWKKLKNYGGHFADEPEDLELKLDWEITDDGESIIFEFQVEDRTAKKSRFFSIPERSKGFQWFFNFTMKLKFNPKYQANQKGAIYLLDEPGSYLHTSAQEELLKKLSDISNTNTILYCTHSQYLLDPEVINIAKIKIAKKEKGVIEAVSFDEAGVTKNEGALTPLYQALHIKSGAFNKHVKHPVITEGITDFYLFSLLKKHSSGFFKDGIDFIPGGGASHLTELISQAIAFSDSYLVLLDSDGAGRDAYEKYRTFFGDEEAKKFFKYRLHSTDENVVLEDHVSAGDKKRLSDITGVADVKAAFPVLYYSKIKDQKEFIGNLDADTQKNLSIVQGKVNGIAKK